MPIFNSKKIKLLELENEQLKNELKLFEDKEEKIDSLDQLLNKLKNETVGLKDLIIDYTITVEYLKSQEQTHKRTIDALNKEIVELREIKSDEQNHLLNLTNHLNELESSIKTSGNEIQAAETIRKIFHDIRTAEERKKELLKEEDNLKEKISTLNQQIDTLTYREQSLQNQLKNKDEELKNTNDAKIYSMRAEIINLKQKIKNLLEFEKITSSDIKSRTKQLLDEEAALNKKINLKKTELAQLALSEQQKGSVETKTLEDRKVSMLIDEQNLVESVEHLKKKINELTASLALMNNEYDNKAKEHQRNLIAFKSKETELELRISEKLNELNELNELKSESDDLKIIISKLNDEQNKISDSIQQLASTEELKRKKIVELNEMLSSKEINIAASEKEITDGKNKLNEIAIRQKQASDALETKHNELIAIVKSIDDKSNILGELNNKISGLQGKVNSLRKEADSYENMKNEVMQKINSEKDLTLKLRDEYKKLKEIVPLLEKKKSEIKQSNENLESRFTDMFRKYSKDLNEISNRRNVLDQIIQKKEKDINDQDQILFEKLAALEESERVLNLRQTEIESFEDLLGTITGQKEMTVDEIRRLENSAIEKKNLNNELQIESVLLKNKIIEFEKGILNVFNGIEARYQQGYSKRIRLDAEVKEYEERLKSLNDKIKDSMNELFDLQQSLTQIKIEHEEHRGHISKLAAMKKKLSDEIARNQKLFEKYREARQKIKNENLIKLNNTDTKEETNYTNDVNFRKYSLPELTKVFKL